MAAKENLSHICSTKCNCTGQVDTKITSMCYFNVKINMILFLISNATWTSGHVGAVSYKAWKNFIPCSVGLHYAINCFKNGTSQITFHFQPALQSVRVNPIPGPDLYKDPPVTCLNLIIDVVLYFAQI